MSLECTDASVRLPFGGNICELKGETMVLSGKYASSEDDVSDLIGDGKPKQLCALDRFKGEFYLGPKKFSSFEDFHGAFLYQRDGRYMIRPWSEEKVRRLGKAGDQLNFKTHPCMPFLSLITVGKLKDKAVLMIFNHREQKILFREEEALEIEPVLQGALFYRHSKEWLFVDSWGEITKLGTSLSPSKLFIRQERASFKVTRIENDGSLNIMYFLEYHFEDEGRILCGKKNENEYERIVV